MHTRIDPDTRETAGKLCDMRARRRVRGARHMRSARGAAAAATRTAGVARHRDLASWMTEADERRLNEPRMMDGGAVVDESAAKAERRAGV